jgi:hypothetical protein
MDRLCLQITNPKHLLSDLCSMLMSNLTKFMAASMEKYQPMLQRWIENRCMDRMFDAFCRGRAYNPQADFHFLASVFTNLAASETFQEYLTSEKCGYPVKSLMIFTENENIIRRGGVIGTLKTLCLLSTGHHDALIDETKVNLLPCLLLPLAGPEEFSEDDMDGMPDELQLLSDDKEREKDKYLRRQLLDSLLALTATRPVREQMRQRKVYPILREAHLNETDPGCEETIQELVQMLMREEEQPQEEGKIMEIIEEETEEDSGQMAIEALI